MIENQPELMCPKGHLIPANRVIASGSREEVVQVMDRNGKPRRNSLIACEECAITASSGLKVKDRKVPMARPDALEKLGQEKISVPPIWID